MKTIQEKIMENVNLFREIILKRTEEYFKEEKCIHPIAFLLRETEDGTDIGVLTEIEDLFADEEGKIIAANLLRETAKHHRVTAIATVFEGWMRIISPQDVNRVFDKDGKYTGEDERPSKAADRIEAVVLSFETHDLHSQVIYRINREKNDPELQILEKVDWSKKGNNLKGIFNNLLQENYNIVAESLREEMKKNVN